MASKSDSANKLARQIGRFAVDVYKLDNFGQSLVKIALELGITPAEECQNYLESIGLTLQQFEETVELIHDLWLQIETKRNELFPQKKIQ